MFIIVLGQHVSILIESFSGPSKIQILTYAAVVYPGIFFGEGGVQQFQLRTEDRENGDLGT